MTTRHACPRCAQRSIDGLLCPGCTTCTRTSLRSTIDLWPMLWETITRQARLTHPTERVLSSRDGYDQLPPMQAQRLADDIRASLVGWVRITCEDLGAPWPTDHISSMVGHLDSWLDAMRRHDGASEMANEVIPWPNRIRRVADYPDERGRVPIPGGCPEMVNDERCGGKVEVVIYENPLTQSVAWCHACGHQWHEWEWRRMGERIEEARAAQAAQAEESA